jgi:TalC/MipB family fructose-6-phosphate aldolase
MEIMFDTANLAEIERMAQIYPFAGVTSNPTILKAAGKIDFFPHFRAIRRIIGPERSLHIQVVARTADGMVTDAHRILEGVDPEVYIKIPVNEAGLQAIKQLKGEGVRVTGTAIYSITQSLLAIAAGVDYLAPYYNRMEAIDIDAPETIRTIADAIAADGAPTRILAASFKNVAQVTRCLRAGAHSVTLAPNLLRNAVAGAHIGAAVDRFNRDWQVTFGTQEIPDPAAGDPIEQGLQGVLAAKG